MEGSWKLESSGTPVKTRKDMKIRKSSFKLKQTAHGNNAERSNSETKTGRKSKGKTGTPTPFLRKGSIIAKEKEILKDASTTPILRKAAKIVENGQKSKNNSRTPVLGKESKVAKKGEESKDISTSPIFRVESKIAKERKKSKNTSTSPTLRESSNVAKDACNTELDYSVMPSKSTARLTDSSVSTR